MDSCKALLTTSDYLPQLGGLTSFTLNLEASLKSIGFNYDLLHWRSSEKKIIDINKYDIVFNVHYLGGYLNPEIRKHSKVVNFIHGSEILFTSPSIFKRVVKKILRKPQLNYFERSYKNIFISNCTYEKLKHNGYKGNYARDLVFHNCINVESANFNEKNIATEVLKVACIARDVPHKNLKGVLQFCEILSDVSGKKVQVYLTSNKTSDHALVEVFNVSNISNEKRDELLAQVHLNLLLSLDHSRNGFYEGFGLSILEGNIFGTPGVVLNSGGLSENVHHQFNGIVLNEVSHAEVESAWIFLSDHYHRIQKNAFEHVNKYHGLNQYKALFSQLRKSCLGEST